MACRETRALLNAFHDGELPGPDRARVEEHLRGCPECRALLADLARADAAAGVPDPGPGYWDRFNARVADRVEREAEGPRVTLLRPERGWVRRQLRYLVPAAAAAALVVTVGRYGGLHPGAPAPSVPTAVREPAAPASPGQRLAKAEPESHGRGLPGAGGGRDATGTIAPAPAQKGAEGAGMVRRVPEESARIADERNSAPREERDRLADRPLSESVYGKSIGKDSAGGDTSAAMTLAKAKEMGSPAPLASAATSAPSPCELARTLAVQGRYRDAEAAQRKCLGQDRSATAQEKGLVFLAELLDRQERFADADDVIREADRQFPGSRPLDFYRQQRPLIQRQPTGVPALR